MHVGAHMLLGLSRERHAFLQERRVETEVNLDVALLLPRALVKIQRSRDELDSRRLVLPFAIFSRYPEVPRSLEHVGVVFVQQLGGNQYGCFRTRAGAESPLQDRRFAP